MRKLLFIALFLLTTHSLLAERATVAFWNVENLYDTIPSGKYDDGGFTPTGERRWNTERYNAKIENIATVIDTLSADIVGLAEVENEAALRDLVVALETPYNYIYRATGRQWGRNVALLYRGDKFFPNEENTRLLNSGTGRKFLCIEGELLGEKVVLVVVHMASNLNPEAYRLKNMAALRERLDEIFARDAAAKIVVMGDMNAVPDDRIVRQTLGRAGKRFDYMQSPHFADLEEGRGSYNYRGRWYLYDWMMVSPSIARAKKKNLHVEDAGIYAREWLTEPASNGTRKPRRSFEGRAYKGGYSDHLPVWIVLEK